ncbi:putative peroxisomal biogenesis factor 6 [Melampsora larici-populina 98AG31]|uniref:Peroxisomal ATPase PEX6 n=1 Tax=Melampsora larici-populina (strain 98AG31 / pathotype 3-4-7) TaxID=747676 RepID=F4RQB5_MELLP|nr:putative peroxisomal biogenesis factor 6 [Melampsora larici-populina 98AG31]EGG05433.1 putative peroxisomal biogenesis factor 6 [Melampsora larici-populina 98AG31]
MLTTSLTTSTPPLLLKPIPSYHHLSSDNILQAFVRTNTLAQLGVCKNDWVLLYSTSNQEPIRLIKLSVPSNPSRLLSDQILISPILIIKLHDLIPIPLDTRLSHFLPLNSTTNDELGLMENPNLLDIDLDLGPPQTIIYFKVTHLECFPTSIPPVFKSSDPKDFNKLNLKEEVTNPIEEVEEDPEMSDLLEKAKLGAILDPNLTKLVQTGVEQSYVPNLASSLGLRGLPPFDPLNLDDEPTRKLYEILRSSSQADATQYDLPSTILINGQRGVGKRRLVSQVTSALGYHLADLSTFSIIGETEIKTSALLESWIERVTLAGPCVLFLRQIEGIARKIQSIETGGREPSLVRILDEALKGLKEKKPKFPVILIGSTSELDQISMGLLNLFKLKLNVLAPNEHQRIRILKTLTERDLISIDVNFDLLGRETSSLVAKDLVTLVSKTRYNGMKRTILQRKVLMEDLKGSGGIQLNQEDFVNSLKEIRKGYSDRIGAPKIPNVRWEDIGGLKEVKSVILETLSLPLNRPELFANGLKKRSGILLFGPPGTGKTLIAKAVATSIGMNFMSVKGPELLDQYIGESESKVRKVFEKAKECKPSVIFFDELDSLAPRRGNQGDSGGVMDRIVSQLLAELDSISNVNKVFVIGATNRPDLLDPALLRPGRFEKLVYLGGIETDENRLEVIKALTRKMKLDEDVRLEEVVKRLNRRCQVGNGKMIVTGADLYSICSDGMMRSMRRITNEIEVNRKRRGSDEELEGVQEVLIKQEDFIGAIEDWKSSVSENEMKHYKAAQLKFTKEGNLLTGMDQDEKHEEEGMGKEGNGNGGDVNGEFEHEGKGKGKGKQKEFENGNGNGKENGKEMENGKGKGKGKQKMI